MGESHTLALFLAELVVLMVAGRVLGEVMSRLNQPAIFGQLIAGVLLGPSVFGLVWPAGQHFLFPETPDLAKMIDAVSQTGILLLLLLTGMESDVALVRRRAGVVLSTSLTGIAVPFLLGVALGFLMPDSLVPDEGRRLVTALFVGTVLSISSVKIVGVVLMEAGFIRRDLGQLILATAMLDDTLAWVIISVVSGMAARDALDLGAIGFSLGAAMAFLAISLTLGRRVVATLIRWSNDTFSVDFPVITTALVITFALALTTDLIGVHTALGAFVAGVLIGQSPILKGHIEAELRGLITAFFSPVFFAVAGLGMDLRTLATPAMAGLALAFIAIASLGKTGGALLGGRLAGLSGRESLALATGLNARGSTEVIIATIGTSLGVVNEPLYTLIVAMAILTTMAMPPSLRWALSRVEIRPEEQARLEKEEAAESEHLTAVERILVIADDSAAGRLVLEAAGAFAAGRQVLATVLERNATDANDDGPAKLARAAAEAAEARLAARAEAAEEKPPARIPLDTLVQPKPAEGEKAAEAEAAKGYNLLFAGVARPLQPDGSHFAEALAGFLEETEIPVVLATAPQAATLPPRRILVPTDGTQTARRAAEIAVALAHATGARLTFLHVIEGTEGIARRITPTGPSVLSEADALARRHGVIPRLSEIAGRHPHRIVSRVARSGGYGLVVLGADLRQDGGRFLGPRIAALLHDLDLPALLVAD